MNEAYMIRFRRIKFSIKVSIIPDFRIASEVFIGVVIA